MNLIRKRHWWVVDTQEPQLAVWSLRAASQVAHELIALLYFFHISHFALVMKYSWQIRRSKWAKQVGWVGLEVTSTSMSVSCEKLTREQPALLVKSWSASAGWTAAGAGAPLEDFENGLLLEWLTKEMRIGRTGSKVDVRTVKIEIVCWKKGQEAVKVTVRASC